MPTTPSTKAFSLTSEIFWEVHKAYRFGFNGKERDNEGMGGGGSTYDYGFRIYNGQIGKFLSVDPLAKSYPMLTPYQFASNMPIWAIDLDGLEGVSYYVYLNVNGQEIIVNKVVEIDIYVGISQLGNDEHYTPNDPPKILEDLNREYNSGAFRDKKTGAKMEFKFNIYTFDVDNQSANDKANELLSDPNNIVGNGQYRGAVLVKHKFNDPETQGSTSLSTSIMKISVNARNPSHTKAHELSHVFLRLNPINPSSRSDHDKLGGLFTYEAVDPSGNIQKPLEELNQKNVNLINESVPNVEGQTFQIQSIEQQKGL